jgi:hypothetical protein
MRPLQGEVLYEYTIKVCKNRSLILCRHLNDDAWIGCDDKPVSTRSLTICIISTLRPLTRALVFARVKNIYYNEKKELIFP